MTTSSDVKGIHQNLLALSHQRAATQSVFCPAAGEISWILQSIAAFQDDSVHVALRTREEEP